MFAPGVTPQTMKDDTMGNLFFRGVFAPVPTPFDVDGSLDVDALQQNLALWGRYRLAGFVLVGSSGEAALLDRSEKRRAWHAAREAIGPGRALIAGTGCESTRATIELTGLAAESGADAALVITPSYYHVLLTPDVLAAHYKAVADASPIPIVLYNMPRYTGVDMNAATVVSLSHHPNILAIKDSSGNLARMSQIAQRAADDFTVLTGSGGAFFPSLAVGAEGGVLMLANMAPAACVEILDLYRAGEWDEAREAQARLVPLNTLISTRLGPPGLKAALDMLGYYGGPARAPLEPPNENDRAAIRAALAEAGLYDEG